MSKALDGYGNLFEAMMPTIAGTPCSRANWTCASWVSRGANDMAVIFLDSR